MTIHTHRRPLTAAELVNQEIAAVRAAWRLTPPAEHYRDPRWFRLAVFAAVRAGRFASRILYITARRRWRELRALTQGANQ